MDVRDAVTRERGNLHREIRGVVEVADEGRLWLRGRTSPRKRLRGKVLRIQPTGPDPGVLRKDRSV